ncbi:NADH-quinone oxidoreductase subunit N [Rhizocola hellebori]|uniref:NADH-quinone oxidoreductase subunit N n=1 Tax=Rhizocola hellebori TaxID=1392758 RepID=A0A8J3QHX8_9ACTN|nr:NADH-quinone oxidoreductase subunit NuoN [Rhizocola hellebori]GIH09967.1 NADH-quinone oxidoreductase subunit N [Rhizocola hellebori]
MDKLKLPDMDYVALLPMLALFVAACLGVIIEALVPRRFRNIIQLVLSIVALAVAMFFVVKQSGEVVASKALTAGGAIMIDHAALFLQGALIVLGFVALLLFGERSLEFGGPFVAQAAVTVGSERDREQTGRELGSTETFPLALFSLSGMLLFVSANDLLTMFVALEVFSLPLYLLCALARRKRLLSQESALKYFLLGAYASAFFLFGVAMVYGFAKAVDFKAIHAEALLGEGNSLLLIIGLALLAIGLLFKVAAAPFHVWTPDVYQGAPTPVTAFMASCTKVAAFGGLLRVLYVGFDGLGWQFTPVLGAIAALTVLVGSILAVTQTDLKRLLAYSSVANAGYILIGVIAGQQLGLTSVLFYLVAYGFTVIAAFALISLVRDADGEATHLSRWAGLGARSPLYAGIFTFILLAFAGIPLTSGFIAKLSVFGAAIDGGQTWLVIIGVITSIILAFPYLRVVVMMWLSEPGESTPSVSIPGGLTSTALGIGTLATLVFGVVPGPLLDLAEKASSFVR